MKASRLTVSSGSTDRNRNYRFDFGFTAEPILWNSVMKRGAERSLDIGIVSDGQRGNGGNGVIHLNEVGRVCLFVEEGRIGSTYYYLHIPLLPEDERRLIQK